jgi:hypothetical protein
MREQRAKRLRAGLCRDCGEPRAPEDKYYCAPHRERARSQSSIKWAERAASGNCRYKGCDLPQTVNSVWCEIHCAMRKKWNQSYHARNREAGRCHSCHEPRSRFSRSYCEKHRHKSNAWNNARAAKSRDKVLEHYGAFCRCCGENYREFLTIDHVRGKGSVDRRQNKTSIYQRIIKLGFPDDFQVLCYNCNCAKRNGPYCPHELRLWVIMGGRA